MFDCKSTPGDSRSGLAPSPSTFSVTGVPEPPPFVVCGVNAIMLLSRSVSELKFCWEEIVYAVGAPDVSSEPAMSLPHSFVRAIIARAESLMLDGAWPSAQLMVGSAVAFADASLDQL